jgi:hypothetical protein
MVASKNVRHVPNGYMPFRSRIRSKTRRHARTQHSVRAGVVWLIGLKTVQGGNKDALLARCGACRMAPGTEEIFREFDAKQFWLLPISTNAVF